MKKTLVLSLLGMALSSTVYVETTVATVPPPDNQTAVTQAARQTWLGVSLAPIPSALAQQLSDIIPDKQGVMVQSVSPQSPAAKAGIQAFDILLSYGDQQLYSPQQLASLVAADKPGNSVTLTLVRKGLKQTLEVTLGSQQLPPLSSLPPTMRSDPHFGFGRMPPLQPFPDVWSRPFAIPHFSQPALPPQGAFVNPLSAQAHVMQQFQSIQIKRLDGDRYHAEVEYQENGGEKKKFTFEGSYQEVREQIKNNKELPQSKKNSLLNALKNNPNQLIPDGFMNFPGFPAFNGFNGFFNNTAPAWQNGNRHHL